MLPDGNVIFYPLDDYKLLFIISEIYYKKIYNSKQIESFKFICDVGAHIGLFTLWVSRMAPNSKITAIEPNSTNFEFLFENILINRLEHRVQTINVAAGDKKRKVDLWVGKLSRDDSSIVKWHNSRSTEHYLVNMCPLDDILSTDENYDLIKIDAEGAEIEILWGLQKTFRKTNRIVMELHMLLIQITEIYKILDRYHFVIKPKQKLYENCWLLEVKRAEL
jgi:FkbM family methyltransferase